MTPVSVLIRCSAIGTPIPQVERGQDHYINYKDVRLLVHLVTALLFPVAQALKDKGFDIDKRKLALSDDF